MRALLGFVCIGGGALLGWGAFQIISLLVG